MSSARGVVVCPGPVLVVASSRLQAAVEDTDEAVAVLTQRGVVADVSSSHRVVIGAGAWRST